MGTGAGKGLVFRAIKEKCVMRIKSEILFLIGDNAVMRKLIIRLHNRMQLNGNELHTSSIHFQDNVVLLEGSNNFLHCGENSFLRQCKVNMRGVHNIVCLEDNTEVYGESVQTVYISGDDNRIILGDGASIRNTSFFIKGNHNTIILENRISCYGTEFHIEQDNNEIRIGKGTTFHGRNGYPVHIALDEGSKVIIGEDCMLSNGIQIRSSDSHSIVDRNRRRLNPAEDIIIGMHCWISMGCIILKGSKIPNNTVIGAGAVVTKKYEEPNCILAGNPAKLVKRDIDWDRKFL